MLMFHANRLSWRAGFYLIAVWLASGLALAHFPISAQEATRRNIPRSAKVELRPTNCENHIAVLEIAHKAAGKAGLLIIIARLGDGEDNQFLNRRRLHNARTYLTDYLGVRSPETIVVAEGERANGYGRVEIYVGGKLFDTLAISRNADLLVGSCEPEELDDLNQKELRKKLYPWLDKDPRQ